MVGWGFDETGRVTEELMQAQMPVVSQQTCVASFPEFYTRFTSPGTYCAGFNNGTYVKLSKIYSTPSTFRNICM